MLPPIEERQRREKEEREREQALAQPLNTNEPFVTPSTASSQNDGGGFGDKISAFFASGSKRGQDQGEIAFQGNASNNTVSVKGELLQSCHFFRLLQSHVFLVFLFRNSIFLLCHLFA